jgi:ATP-dependent RNA helicase SUPV3L1/SUV3
MRHWGLFNFNRYSSTTEEVSGPMSQRKLANLMLNSQEFVDYAKDVVGISTIVLSKAVRAFCNHQLQLDNTTSALHRRWMENASSSQIADELGSSFRSFVDTNPTKVNEWNAWLKLKQVTDLREPHLWFPMARTLKRRIIYHAGPTNSGKTHNALKSMMHSPTGLYAAPLRLLALEAWERLQQHHIPSSLVTGQEVKEQAGDTHVSCTVEMSTTTNYYDVAVIDEIQMLGDAQRGWAWTRALLGLYAGEIHVCGDASAINIVEELAAKMGDSFEVRHYQRRSRLSLEKKSLRDNLQNIVAGDCVIAFSRRNVYGLRRMIERETGLRCCVVYGGLPPATRAQQAALFNDANSGYDVLVATDAVGMGLNLQIRRIVFSQLEKFNGYAREDLAPTGIKQIAGRAGRFGSRYPNGLVTCLSSEDMPLLAAGLDTPLTPIAEIGLFPMFEQIESFVSLQEVSTIQDKEPYTFAELLSRFVQLSALDGNYFMCKYEEIAQIAQAIEHVPLSLKDRYTFCMAPCNLRTRLLLERLVQYAENYARAGKVPLDVALPPVSRTVEDETADLERLHNALDMYLWLGLRYPHAFIESEDAQTLRSVIGSRLDLCLSRVSVFHRSRKKPKHGRNGDKTAGDDKNRRQPRMHRRGRRAG